MSQPQQPVFSSPPATPPLNGTTPPENPALNSSLGGTPPRMAPSVKEELLEGRVFALSRENEQLRAEVAAQRANSVGGHSPSGGPPPPSYTGGFQRSTPSQSGDGDMPPSPMMQGQPPPFYNGSTPPSGRSPSASIDGDMTSRYNALYADFHRISRQREDEAARHKQEYQSLSASLRVAQLERQQAMSERQRFEGEIARLTQRNNQMNQDLFQLQTHLRDQNQKIHEMSSGGSTNGAASPGPSSNNASASKKNASRKQNDAENDPAKQQALIEHLQRLVAMKDQQLKKVEGHLPEAFPVAIQVTPEKEDAVVQTEPFSTSPGGSDGGEVGRRSPAPKREIASHTTLADSLLVTTRPIVLSLRPLTPPDEQDSRRSSGAVPKTHSRNTSNSTPSSSSRPVDKSAKPMAWRSERTSTRSPTNGTATPPAAPERPPRVDTSRKDSLSRTDGDEAVPDAPISASPRWADEEDVGFFENSQGENSLGTSVASAALAAESGPPTSFAAALTSKRPSSGNMSRTMKTAGKQAPPPAAGRTPRSPTSSGAAATLGGGMGSAKMAPRPSVKRPTGASATL